MRALIRLLAVAAVVFFARAAAPAGAAPAFSFFGSGTFAPGSPVRVQVWSPASADIEVGVVPIALDEVVAVTRRTATPQLAADITEDRRPIKTVRARLEPDPKTNSTRYKLVDVGPLPIGFYGLRMRANGRVMGVELATVSALGVMTADTGRAFTALAIDLRTMHARSDVTFERYAAGTANADARRTDASGLASFDSAPGQNDVLISRAGDGSVVVGRGLPGSEGAGAAHLGFVQTDRPIYRPGHHVMYRAILRDGTPGSFAVPSGEQSVRLRDPSGKTVYTAQQKLDAFGTLSGEITLADDAELGTYSLDAGNDDDASNRGSFVVEAYKKPEYVVDVAAPPATPGGDAARFGIAARYFFGRPAAGMKLHYRASFRSAYAWWRRGSPFRFAGYSGSAYEPDQPAVEGDAVADGVGRAKITIPTMHVTTEKQLHVEVDGRDASGHTVTAQADAQVTPASFYLTVLPKTYFNTLGDTLELDVRSLGYAARAVARPHTPVTVAFSRLWWENGRAQHDEQTSDTQSVVTDGAGSATVRWKPAQGGYFEVRARSRDERGRDVSTTAGVWIASAHYDRSYAFTQTTVVPQKAEYRPGERATLLVTALQGDVDALVHVASVAAGADRVYVRRLATSTSTIEVDPPAGVASYRVTVSVPTRSWTAAGSAMITVAPQPHRLRVAIRPDKAKYAPGERARFAVSVGDADGKPVRAQIGLAVVDDAIFALRQANTPDPYAVFYRGNIPYRQEATSWGYLDQPLTISIYPVSPRLQTIGSTTSRSAATTVFAPSATADMYNVTTAALMVPPAPSFDKLRTDFRDTAYWTPAVVTGNDGRAVVAFDWPDSLTSYTASGLAVTQQTDLGSGTGSALVTKDFLVRLSAPRFLRRGDAARLTGIAQGTRSAKTALLRFSAPDLGVADDTASARFDANATATARWDVRGGALGSAPMRLAGTSEALRDGLRIALPVESSGTPEHDRAAGTLPASASVALALPRGAEAGDLRVDLAPSALAQLAAGVRLLQVYPYYCVEQTMSAALPAIYVDRMRKRIKLPPPEGPAPKDVAKRAVDRLVQLQHGDGSWGWWEHDDANPFMTAYALYGLAELAHEGYPVPSATLDRGAKSLAQQAAANADTLAFWGGRQSGSEWNTRAFMLFALADAQPKSVDRELLAKTDAQAAKLNAYALAVLGLAHLELSDRAGAQPLLTELLTRVTDDGTKAQWSTGGWHYGWQDDPIETTAYALRFVHAMTPDDPRVARAVSWLRTQQHGSWFETTKDTAAAIYAMTEAVPVQADELDPHETVRITLGNRVLKSVRIDAPVLPRAVASFTVPAKLLRGGGTLRFERTGTGALSWSTDWTQYVREPAGPQLDPTFSVMRTYSAENGNDWRIGDLIDVDVTVTAKSDAQFVAVEDPFPAGLEYQPKQYESGDGWSGLQFFDDRVVFFADRVWSRSPLHLHYTLRATTAGFFTAPATSVYAMYGPPLSATGRPAHIAIR